ncbi:MAG TPA: hypothetical protein VIY48_09210 [Candidatus Paceibacterota bacterium]
MPTSSKKLRQLVVIEMILIIVLGAWLGMLYYNSGVDEVRKDRDALRLAEISTIETAMTQYALKHNSYPSCLYATAGCPSLEGSAEMTVVPKDPLTELPYSYSAFYSGTGSNSVCTGYHLGSSLERKGSQSLLAGNDAPPKADKLLCAGSPKDFSGLSYAPGGQPCTLQAGIAQPTDADTGETCYDIEHIRLPPTLRY